MNIYYSIKPISIQLCLCIVFSLFLSSGIKAIELTSPVYLDMLTIDPSEPLQGHVHQIARTTDDRIAVIYVNNIEDQPNIFWIEKPFNSDAWYEPVNLGAGVQPAITIDEDNNMFAIWCGIDNKKLYLSSLMDSEENWSTPVEITPTGGKELSSPNIEVNSNNVLIVWTANSGEIYYQGYNKQDLTPAWEPIRLGFGDYWQPIKASIAGDAQFADVPFHIFWADGYDNFSYIYHVAVLDDSILAKPVNEPTAELQNSAACPSISIIASKRAEFAPDLPDYISYINLATISNNFLLTGHTELDQSYRYRNFLFNGYPVSGYSDQFTTYYFRCSECCILDDSYGYNGSIIWTQNQHILLNSIAQGELLTDEETVVIADGEFEKIHHINICYRSFRENFLDVVWLEGNETPYKLMFCRVPKSFYIRYSDEIKISESYSQHEITQGEPFNYMVDANSGTLPYKWVVLDNSLPSGLTLDSDTGEIYGEPEESGTFLTSIGVQDSGEPATYVEATLEFQIKYNPTIIKAPMTKVGVFQLHPAFPNPFNAQTQIRYKLPQKESVNIQIYNLQGEMINSVTLGEQNPGSYSYQWNASELPSGTYFIKLEAGAWQQIRKCALLK